jgi:L-lactate utilization protein LutC
MANKPILAVQLNAVESAKLTEAVKADQSARALAGEVGVLYVKRTKQQVWDPKSPFYVHFASAIEAVILKAAPNYSNTRMLVSRARECAKDWYVAEGDADLKAARDAADDAKAIAKLHDAKVAVAEAQAKREDITVSEQKLAKAALTQAKADRTSAKATANTKATEYAVAYEAKFPRPVTLLSKQDKLDEFVKAVKTIKAKFEALEDASVDKYVHEATTAYLEKMKRWTEVAPAK